MSQVQIFAQDSLALQQKLRTILQDGCAKLKLISDFDSTLSTAGFSSWCAIEQSKLLSDRYRSRTRELGALYYPKEIDPTLTFEEKSQFMVLWWTQAQEALREEKITRDTYNQILLDAQHSVHLRQGCDLLFQYSNSLGVPLLVFSAGVGDIIDSVLLHNFSKYYTPHNPYYPIAHLPILPTIKQVHQSLLPGPEGIIETSISTHSPSSPVEYGAVQGIPKTVHIIANHLEFARDITDQNDPLDPLTPKTFKTTDLISGFRDNKSIHVFNKHYELVKNAPYFTSEIHPRTNAIVLGDSLGDALMHNDPSDTVIRLGFLNTSKHKSVTSHINQYMAAFDIVFVDSDLGIDWVNQILDFTRSALQDETMVGDHLAQQIDRLVTQLTSQAQVGLPQ